MSGIEQFNDTSETRTDANAEMFNLCGVRIFKDVDPEQARLVVESTIDVTDDEAAACGVVAALIQRHKDIMAEKIDYLIANPKLSSTEKSMLVKSVMSLSTVTESFKEILRIVSKEKDMTCLIDRSVSRAIREALGSADEPMSADVEQDLS